MEGLNQTTKNPQQDSRPSGRNLNMSPTEYEAGAVTVQPRRYILISTLQNDLLLLFSGLQIRVHV